MTPLSRHRMHRLLDVWAAGGTELYDLVAIDYASGVKRYREGWDRSQVDRARKFISRLNHSGYSVLVRPSSLFPTCPWILVDRVTASGLEILERSVPPAVLLESSRRNHLQAWVRLEPPMSGGVRTAVARFVGDLVGGAAGTFGWLPGTTDREPARDPGDDQAPFVRFRAVNRSAWTPLEKLQRKFEFSCVGTEEEVEHESPVAPSRSRRTARDFAIAMRLIEAGYDDRHIEAVLAKVSSDCVDASRDDYIQRTIRAARMRAEVPSGRTR